MLRKYQLATIVLPLGTIFFIFILQILKSENSTLESAVHGHLRANGRLPVSHTSVGQQFVQNRSNLKHLVIVTGHSTLTTPCVNKENLGAPTWKVAQHEDKASPWLLLPYQVDQKLPQSILDHIGMGISLTKEDKEALLLFSGGQTRTNALPMSEALSYYLAARAVGALGGDDGSVQERTFLEEYATDSLENVLFSICRFHELTGHYPEELSVISFDYKEQRFNHFVQKALRWPRSKYHFYGIDPPDNSGFDVSKAKEYEQVLLQGLEVHPYGCGDEDIDKKRDSRNPFSRTVPYQLSCTSILPLLKYCGKTIFSKSLPWH